MSLIEQEYIRDIYSNIHGWLAKSGGQNSKVSIKTKSVLQVPYPDIVGWWKSVNVIFAVSTMETENRVEKLNHFVQLPGEKMQGLLCQI